NPSGPTRWSRAPVAKHSLPMLPVLGGISGSTRTILKDGVDEAHSGIFNQPINQQPNIPDVRNRVLCEPNPL
ncbi:MAG: hypothetical protein ACI9R3_006375, partial [Verrucomicrobiales bacterium]